MRIFNDGANAVITVSGRLDAKKFMDVPEAEAKKLMGMYVTIKDAKKMIGMEEEKEEASDGPEGSDAPEGSKETKVERKARKKKEKAEKDKK